MKNVDLLNYQQRAEAFWHKEMDALSRSAAGLDTELDLEAVYKEYADLFSLDTVRWLLQSAPGNSDLQKLAEFAVLRHLQGRAAEIDDELFNHLAFATIPWDGQDVPFYATDKLLANEPDAGRRRALYANRAAVIASCDHLREERWRRMQTAARELGFAHYRDLCDRVRMMNLSRLAAEARSFLEKTNAAYRAALHYWWPLIVGDAPIEAASLSMLHRGQPFDPFFPKDRLIETLDRFSSGLGFPLDQQRAIEIDCEDRPGKVPRSFCAFVRVPQKIRLVISPRGGCADYHSGLHELGHAMHGAHIADKASFAMRCLGDDSVGEAWAFLFENLTGSIEWLAEDGMDKDWNDYRAYEAFIRLASVRRSCAQFLFEYEFHGEGATAERYQAILSEHMDMEMRAEFWLANIDDAFYIAQYLRGWMLEAQVSKVLRRKFGKKWYQQPETGEWLRGLWISGQPTADAISMSLGFRGMELSSLADELTLRI